MLRLCRQEADDMRDGLGREEVDAVAGVGDPVGRPLEGEVALQLGVGFALTVLTIWMLPLAAEWLGGWRWTFLLLVPGPVIGATAMLALRRHPESVRMAGGRR